MILNALNLLNLYDDARKIIAVRVDGSTRRKAVGMVSLDWEATGFHIGIEASWDSPTGAAMDAKAYRNVLDEGGLISINGTAMQDCDIDLTVERKSLRTYVIVYSLEYVEPETGVAHDIDLLARVKLVDASF